MRHEEEQKRVMTLFLEACSMSSYFFIRENKGTFPLRFRRSRVRVINQSGFVLTFSFFSSLIREKREKIPKKQVSSVIDNDLLVVIPHSAHGRKKENELISQKRKKNRREKIFLKRISSSRHETSPSKRERETPKVPPIFGEHGEGGARIKNFWPGFARPERVYVYPGMRCVRDINFGRGENLGNAGEWASEDGL